MTTLSLVMTLGCSAPDDNAGSAGGGGGSEMAPPYAFRAGTNGFEVRGNGGEFQPFWPIGMNYGHGIPGTFPGEFYATREQIAEFIQAMGDLGANSVRVYTVQSPLFYEELKRYNEEHPNKPLFLLQGAWLAEPTDDPEFAGVVDYYSPWVEARFADELEKAVDAVHGNRAIPMGSPDNPDSYGRAFGEFTADVSPWLMGWLIGREMEPLTMRSTHDLYYAKNCGGIPCTVDFDGEYMSVAGATPSEAIVTRFLDFVTVYEDSHYDAQHPVAFSNWPTLDPIDHLVVSEFDADDMEALDLRKIQVSDRFKAGLYFSYHAYPYYPEFVQYEPSFQVDDGVGINPYLGYLQKLRTEYAGRTLIIGEIGLPSSQGTAHFATTGLSHGGLNEVEQGEGVLRTIRNITQADLNGAFLFELIDEWWKRSWVVDPLELPADRRHLWYNTMSPEQNFGFVAVRPGGKDDHHEIDGEGDDFPEKTNVAQDGPPLSPLDAHDPARTLRALTIDSDEGFLHLLLRVESLDPDGNGKVDWDKVDYLFAFDTLDPARGDKCLDPTCAISVERRVEYLLRIDSEQDVTLNVDRPYDVSGVWRKYFEPSQFQTEANDDGLFNVVRTLTNHDVWYGGEHLLPVTYQETGRFKTGPESVNSSSNVWYSLSAGTIELRIPWTLLNITDPSQRMVVDGYPGGVPTGDYAHLTTTQTPEIVVFVAALGGVGEQESKVVDTLPKAANVGGSWVVPAQGAATYTWATWDANPRYRMYRKQSFGIVRDALPGVVPAAAHVTP